MSLGIVRLICVKEDGKVVSLLLEDCFMTFDFDYPNDIQTYEMEFKLPYTEERHAIIKDLFRKGNRTKMYLSAGKTYYAHAASFMLFSNEIIVDDTRPEGHILLNKPSPFRLYKGNVEGYFAEVDKPWGK